MDEKLIDYLNMIAKTTGPTDHFDDSEMMMPYEMFGGNMDDAYYGGIKTGRIGLARELLAKFFKNE